MKESSFSGEVRIPPLPPYYRLLDYVNGFSFTTNICLMLLDPPL
jgi:hypothetical protein